MSEQDLDAQPNAQQSMAALLSQIMPQSIAGTPMAPPPPGPGNAPISPGSVLPPTSPVVPQPGPRTADVSDQMGLTRQDITERLGRERSLEGQIDPLIKQRADMPMPQMGYQPHLVHGQGVSGFLKNLLTALETVGVSTAPGRNVESAIYGPGIRKYAAGQQSLADQINQLKGQQEESQKSLSPLQAMAYHYGTVTERGRHDQATEQIQQEKADTAAQATVNRHTESLARLAQGSTRLDLQKNAQSLKSWYDHALIDTAQARTAAGMSENDARIAAQKDIVSAVQADKRIDSHSVLDILGLGGLMTPVQGPAGAGQPTPVQPKAGNNPPARNSGRSGVSVTAPDGSVHTFPNQAAADKFKKLAGIR